MHCAVLHTTEEKRGVSYEIEIFGNCRSGGFSCGVL